MIVCWMIFNFSLGVGVVGDVIFRGRKDGRGIG